MVASSNTDAFVTIVLGNKVVDHERIVGVRETGAFEAVAIYEVVDGRIDSVWFFNADQ